MKESKRRLALLACATAIVSGIAACTAEELAALSPSVESLNPDAAPNVSDAAVDSSRSDASSDASEPRATQKFIYVNGAGWLGREWASPNGATTNAIRVCLKVGPESGASFLPGPPVPSGKQDFGGTLVDGIPLGAGGVLPISADFSATRVELFAMNGKRLAERGAEVATCQDLFAKGYVSPGATSAEPIQAGIDFLALGSFEVGTFSGDSTYVITLTGCVAGGTVNSCATGPGFDSKENLKLDSVKLDRSPVAAAELGGQFIHAITGFYAVSGKVEPGIQQEIRYVEGGPPPDASAAVVNFRALSQGAVTFSPSRASALTRISSVQLGGANRDVIALTPSSLVQFPFSSLTSRVAPPTQVNVGTSYVFVGVMNAQANVSVLAFPVNPEVPGASP